MSKKSSIRGTFLIQIVNTQHATWQGTINWIEEKKTQPFRSTLELIKLIDGSISSAPSEAKPVTSEDTSKPQGTEESQT